MLGNLACGRAGGRSASGCVGVGYQAYGLAVGDRVGGQASKPLLRASTLPCVAERGVCDDLPAVSHDRCVSPALTHTVTHAASQSVNHTDFRRS